MRVRHRVVSGVVAAAGLTVGAVVGAGPAAADHVGQILDIVDVGTASQRTGSATIQVQVDCQAGVEAHLDVELYQKNFRTGTYDVTYFTCTGSPQTVDVVYDGGTYSVPKAGKAYGTAYLEMPVGDGSPEDLYGEAIRIRGGR